MRASREKIEKILSLKNMPVEILMVTENINNPACSRTSWRRTCA